MSNRFFRSTGYVLKERAYVGSVSPPDTFEDESRYGNHGTHTGITMVQLPNTLWVRDFNSATPDYITIPAADATNLNFTSSDFSFVLWVKFDDISAGPIIFLNTTSTKEGYQFYPLSSGLLRLYTYQAAANQSTETDVGSVTTAVWYMLGVTRNGAAVKIYINGVDATATPDTHIDPDSSTGDFLIGIWYDLTSAPFDGQMALLRSFNHALSAERMAAIFQAERHWLGV